MSRNVVLQSGTEPCYIIFNFDQCNFVVICFVVHILSKYMHIDVKKYCVRVVASENM